MTTRRALLLSVYLPSALLAFGQGILLPTLPVFALDFDVSFAMAALAISMAGVGTMVADIPAGMILGRLGLKPTMLIGTGLVVFSLFALGFASSLPELLVYRFIFGVGEAMWSVSRASFIAESVHPRERGRAISIFGGLNRVGLFGGPVLGGFFAEAFGIVSAFYLAGVLSAAAFVVAMLFVEETRVAFGHTHRMRWTIVWDLLRENRRDLTAASVAQMSAQMIRAGRQAIIPFYAESVLGLSVGQIGTIQSASSMVDMALFFPAGYIMDRFGRKFTSVPSFALMSLGMALLPLASGFFSLLAVVMVIGFGNGLGSGAMMTLGADYAPRGASGEFLGLWRFIGDSGRAGGPLAVGTLADAVGFDATALILATVGFASSATLLLLVRETRDVGVAMESGPSP